MMKKLLYFLLLGSMLSSCSNDFEVSAPWKEVPVAYALLSPKDSAHYVRIEKAFLDPNVSALEIAQIADSLYYPENDIAVWLACTITVPAAAPNNADVCARPLLSVWVSDAVNVASPAITSQWIAAFGSGVPPRVSATMNAPLSELGTPVVGPETRLSTISEPGASAARLKVAGA